MTEVGERQRSEIGCRRTERRRTERRRTEDGVNKGAKVKREEANGYSLLVNRKGKGKKQITNQQVTNNAAQGPDSGIYATLRQAKTLREEANGYAFAIKNVRKIYVFLLIMRSLEVPELGFT